MGNNRRFPLLQKDVDSFFDQERNHLLEYHAHVKDASAKADRTCRLRKNVAESYAKIADNLVRNGSLEAASGDKEFGRFLTRMTDVLERLKKLEARIGSDQELKEADTLRYFTRETQAGKVRRRRARIVSKLSPFRSCFIVG